LQVRLAPAKKLAKDHTDVNVGSTCNRKVYSKFRVAEGRQDSGKRRHQV
jgi:hypothetical protein